MPLLKKSDRERRRSLAVATAWHSRSFQWMESAPGKNGMPGEDRTLIGLAPTVLETAAFYSATGIYEIGGAPRGAGAALISPPLRHSEGRPKGTLFKGLALDAGSGSILQTKEHSIGVIARPQDFAVVVLGGDFLASASL